MDYIYDEMVRQNADGVDFIPIWIEEGTPPIICSYTKEEFKIAKWFPKTNWKLWKNVNRSKIYISDTEMM